MKNPWTPVGTLAQYSKISLSNPVEIYTIKCHTRGSLFLCWIKIGNKWLQWVNYIYIIQYNVTKKLIIVCMNTFQWDNIMLKCTHSV